jgi:plastocyanin
MHSNLTLVARASCALFVAFALVGCASGGGAGWTYAPLGPTQSAGAGQSGAPASPGGSPQASPAGSPQGSPAASPAGSPQGSPGGSPAGSPGGGTTFDVVTEQSAPLAFVPNTLTAPANTSITVNYNNNSSIQHNINFFNGPDNTAPSLAKTPVVTGPNAIESVTFTTPAQPGNYYFWCDVHASGMAGTLVVE